MVRMERARGEEVWNKVGRSRQEPTLGMKCSLVLSFFSLFLKFSNFAFSLNVFLQLLSTNGKCFSVDINRKN